MYLPTTAILTRLLGLTTRSTKFLPVFQVGFGRFEVQKIADELVESLGVQGQRHLVDRVLDVAFLDHRLFHNAAKHRQLTTHIAVERFFRAANQHLRLQSDFAQFRHALLRRLRFQFVRGLDVGNERDMHVHHIFGPDFKNELANRLEKRKTFDVSSRASDFRDHHVVFGLV